MITHPFPITILIIPCLIWAASYAYLAAHHKRLNLFQVPIHESGRYTLLATVFYWPHFLRELLIDFFYALPLAWSLQAHSVRSPLGGGWSFWVVLALPSLAWLASVLRGGLRESFNDLLQFRELDTMVEWGSHWNMHWFSTWMLMLAFALPGALRETAPLAPLFGLMGAFVALSLIFRTRPPAWQNPRWLLHGGREILTFGLLLGLPMLSPLLFKTPAPLLVLGPAPLLLMIALLLGALHLLRVARKHPVREHAQADLPLAYLVASHFFEHVLDWIWILALVDLLLSA